jgi:hypothetical protein
MECKTNLEKSIRRWQTFWQHSVADRPPLVIRTYQKDVMTSDDTIPQIDGQSGLSVTGWMFGAKVKTIAGISWVEPILNEAKDWHSIDFDAVGEKADSILESYRKLVKDSQGRYAISPGVLEGPADIAVRLLGEQKLALALYDYPDTVKSMFTFLTDFARELAIKKLNIIPRFDGGTACNGYWIPGKGIGIQEDFGQMISPQQFREVILKHDRTIVKDLDNVWFHIHSGALQMAKEIVDSGTFGCIQITNDYPAGPSPKEMIPTLQYIQKRCCLILRKLSLDQLDSIIKYLSPEGLALDIQCYDSTITKDIQTTLMTNKEAEQVIAWADDWINH